jgi:hypothetical protein
MTYRVLKVALVFFALSVIGLGVISALLYWWHMHLADQCVDGAGVSCYSDTVFFVNWSELAVLLSSYFCLCVVCSWLWHRMRATYRRGK